MMKDKVQLEPLDHAPRMQPTKYLLPIGNSFVFSYDTHFFEGFECGYNERALSDQDGYTVVMKIVEVTKSGRYQAGFITGWMAALFESVPGTTNCNVTTIPFLPVI